MATSVNSNPDFEDILEPRRFNGTLRWATRSFKPSPYFIRGRVRDGNVQEILNSENIKRTIKEVAKSEAKSEKEVTEQAKAILVELAHDYHLFAIRWFAIMLSKLGKGLYKSIQIDSSKIEHIRETFKNYPVILLPTHRSYVDFLLISYIFFHYDLPLPIIAAGMDFMGMSGLGEMLRKSGAFFIRRRFGGDVLYWAIVTEYLKREVLQGGHPLEMFVEGKRSRTAKSLPPKHGLLAAALDLVRTGEVQDIKILPISMSYDRTLEEKLYSLELLGNPKPKESTNGLMKALRWLKSQSYGSIYVTFGDFISTRTYLERHIHTNVSPFGDQVQNIAYQVVLENQKNLIVPIISLVSVIVQSKISEGEVKISIGELLTHLNYFSKILAHCEKRIGLPLIGQSLEANLKYILNVHKSLVDYDEGSQTILLHNDSNNITFDVYCMQFQHYANQIIPILFPFAFVIRFNERNGDWGTGKKRLEISEGDAQDYTVLRSIFAEDFLYRVGFEKEELYWGLEMLNSLGRENVQTERILSHCLDSFIFAYLAAYRSLLKLSQEESGPFHAKMMERKAQEHLHQRIIPHTKAYGALSLETINNALSSQFTRHSFTKLKMEDGTFGYSVKDYQRLEELISILSKVEGGHQRRGKKFTLKSKL